MELVYGENWGLTLTIAIILTWGIGLVPPLVIRFVILRRPVSKGWAILTAAIFVVANLTIFIVMGSKSKTHGAVYLIAIASYYILRKAKKNTVTVEPENLEVDTAKELVGRELQMTKPNAELIGTASGGTDAKTSNWPRRLLIAWGMMSVAWVIFLGVSTWSEVAPLFVKPLFEDSPVSTVNILTEVVRKKKSGKWVFERRVTPVRKAPAIESNIFKSKNPFEGYLAETSDPFSYLGIEHSPDHRAAFWFPGTRLKPGSSGLADARNYFPSFKDKSGVAFSNHLWGLVSEKINRERSHRKSKAERKLAQTISVGVALPTGTLVIGFALFWLMRRYPPSSLTKYLKRVIAILIIWVMGAGSSILIFGRTFIRGGEEQLLFIFLPPIVYIVAATLWKWANRGPAN
jgi:hypothetical protein